VIRFYEAKLTLQQFKGIMGRSEKFKNPLKGVAAGSVKKALR
jgi:hypothetical protein